MDAAARGRIIRPHRRRRGYSQAVLARLVGRSESLLSQVERGKLPVDSHDVLSRLADVLRLSLEESTGTEPEGPSVRYTPVDVIERTMMRYTSLETIVADDSLLPTHVGMDRPRPWPRRWPRA